MPLLESPTARIPNSGHWALIRSRRFLSRHFVLIGVALCVVIWLGILLCKWPFTKNAATAGLREESGKSVRIGAFHLTLSPLGYVAENISLSSEPSSTGKPELTVRKLVVIARLFDVVLMRKRIDRVSIIGLRATLPTEGASGGKPGPPRFSEVGQLQFEDALIRFRSFESDPDPLALAVKNLTFKDMSRSRSGSFAADLSINKPQGAVRVSGQIGPWDWKQIGETRISGSFSIPHADLASFGGIGGVMNASGRFSGSLRRVMCDGSATVPDFQISRTRHSVDLSTTYRATIDGLNGDVTLNTAESHFGRTIIDSKGFMKSDGQSAGKVASLRLSIEEGQIGDVLLLFTRAPQPSIAGTVDLRLNVELPPGPLAFLERLTFNGDFGIDRGRFTKCESANARLTI